ncbi:MAG: hypothetical protein HY898_15830 [Deltaproteobacteria bacterium]|nr:hypothetical protein [Deltaproteobacteria bacterium]
MRTGAGVLWGVALVSAATSAQGYDTGSRSTGIFPSGYMSCHEERRFAARPSPRAEAKDSPPLIVPLPTRKHAPTIVLGEDLADEVAMVEPVPAGREHKTPAVPPAAAPPVMVVTESKNNYLCLGLVRGRPGILRAITAPPGARFYGHPYEDDWRIDNMVAASVFNLVETRAALRAALSRPIVDKKDFDKTELRSAAAVALSEIGDKDSAPAIASWTEELESRTFGFQYRSVLHALERLDPAAADKYAAGMLQRVADGKLGARVNADLLRPVVMLTPASRDAVLPTLRRLTSTGSSVSFDGATWSCVLTAARLRYGDPELVPLAREQIFGSLTNNLAVNCYSEWLPATIGKDPSDVEALLLRQAYEPMLRFVMRVRELRQQRATPVAASGDWERAASKLLTEMGKKLSSPQMGDRSRNDYFPTHRAMHLAVMAGLEDANARDLLYKMIEDPTDETDGAWVAAFWALKLGLPGAAGHVLRRLEMGIEKSTHLATIESSVGVLTTWRTRVLGELVRVLPASDSRWAIALLDRESPTREKAVMLLSRHKPAGACQSVLAAAPKAQDDTIKQAFWALSILGDACREPMLRASRDSSLKPDVRGPAIVLLAMIRAPEARAMVDAVAGHRDYRLYVQTAEIILRSPE